MVAREQTTTIDAKYLIIDTYILRVAMKVEKVSFGGKPWLLGSEIVTASAI